MNNIKAYVDNGLRYFSIKILWISFLGCLFVSTMDLFFTYMLSDRVFQLLILSITAITFMSIVVATIFRRRDLMVLSTGIMYTNWAIVLLIMGYLALSTAENAPKSILAVQILLYVFSGIMIILIVKRNIKKGFYIKQMKSTGVKKVIPYFAYGVAAAIIVPIIAGQVQRALDYDTHMIVVLCVLTLFGMFCSTGCTAYLSFYYMRKYKISCEKPEKVTKNPR